MTALGGMSTLPPPTTLSLLSCRRGFERGAVRPSALQGQVGNFLPAFWYLGGTFRPEVVAVLERVKDTDKAYFHPC